MKKLFCLNLIVFALYSSGITQPCSCLEQFNFFEEKIRHNYAGYADKMALAKASEWQAHTEKHRDLATSAIGDSACFQIITSWKTWFRDGHVQLSRNFVKENIAPEQIRSHFKAWEKLDISEEKARVLLSDSGKKAEEGIYKSTSGNYKVAVLRQKEGNGRLVGIILKADSIYWVPGQVKFELQENIQTGLWSGKYYMLDHTLIMDTATFSDGLLRFKKGGDWYMVFPENHMPGNPNRVYQLKSIDSSTALLVLPSMNERYRRELDSLLKANKKWLSQTPNLIIDCRGNGGGSDITFRRVTPLLYTNPIFSYRLQVYATKDNAKKYAALQKNKNYPWYYRAYGGYMKRKINRNLGTFIGKKGIDKSKRRKVYHFPEKVVVLIDEHCGSSCESFVMIAKQSKKVTLMGAHTAGISDYGNLHFLNFPCGNLGMSYPTTRSSAVDEGKGIDNIGINPDVPLDAHIPDWVEYARDYLLKI